MPVQWTGKPLSYADFKATIGAKTIPIGSPVPASKDRFILVEESPLPQQSKTALGVKFSLREANGKIVTRTSPAVIEDPDRTLSAAMVASWCKPLGIDPTTLGIDDKW